MIFHYQGRDAAGKAVAGSLEAVNAQLAAQEIRQRGFWVTALVPQKPKAGERRTFPWRERLRFASLRGGRLVLFYRQVSVLLQAGLPIHEALRTLQNSQDDSAYQQMLFALLRDLLAGRSLAAAMSQLPCFSAVTVQLVRAGEAGGSLEQVFLHLADYQEQAYRTREKLKSLLAYPLILLLTTLVALFFITVFILPTFRHLLLDLGAELPWPTQFLFFLSNLLQQHLGLCLSLALGILGSAILLYRLPRCRYYWDCISLHLPLWGSLQRDAAWLLVLRTFAVLLANGLPVHQALAFAGQVTENRYLRAQLQQAQAQVEAGRPLGIALAQIPVLPQVLCELLQAGEQAGQLEAMLQKAAAFSALQLSQQAKRLEALAEPVALFFVGGLVFFLVLAIILPLLGTLTVLG